MNYDGSDYFFHRNHLGSITEITDIYQSTVKTYDYDAFGALLAESGSLDHNAFTYTGREYHPRSGLYYYRARFYDPQTGRFITPDPIGILGGVNLYAYVGNEPVDCSDPLGLIQLTANVRQADYLPGPFAELILGQRNNDFFSDFLLGRGDRERYYGSDCPETKEMAASPGADALRQWFMSGSPGGTFDYDRWRAFRETRGNLKGTPFQVGGWLGTAVDNGDGTVTFTIRNPAGLNSFSGGYLPDLPWTWTRTPMRTIRQTFEWTEPIR